MTTTRKKFLQQSALALLGVCLPGNKILGSLFTDSLSASTPSPTIMLFNGSSHEIAIYRAQAAQIIIAYKQQVLMAPLIIQMLLQ